MQTLRPRRLRPAQVVRQLRQTGRVRRPYIGIQARPSPGHPHDSPASFAQAPLAVVWRQMPWRPGLSGPAVTAPPPQILELTPGMAAFISDRDKRFPQGVTSGVLIPRVR